MDRSGPNGCWNWTGKRTHSGYGVFWLNGKSHRAHRVSLEWAIGEAPADKPYALHSCDNRLCVNPDHLRWGDAMENFEDRELRKGPVVGEAIATARITTEVADSILRMRIDGLRLKEIAEQLSLPKTLVENVYTGSSWKHRHGVDGNPTLEELKKAKPKKKRPAPNRIVTDDMVDLILKSRMQGKSARALAKTLGLPLGTVSPIHSGLAFTHRLGVDGNPTLAELRSVRAENPTYKLTEDDVSEIRSLLAKGYLGADLATKYKVSRSIISNIKTGKR